ncbi:MAG: DsrE family protein [Bacteroidales bacterium]
MQNRTAILLTILIISFASQAMMGQNEPQSAGGDSLVIVWTSDDPYLAERMVLMYTHAAKTAGWFDHVTLIIWGPSAKLTAENLKIRDKLAAMLEDGVVIEACIVCANAYDVTGDLKDLGFDVKGMGKPLSDYLKSGKTVLTF